MLWQRLYALLWDDAGVYLLIVAGGLFLASWRPWLSVSLLQRYSPWSIPLDIGWGIRSSIVSYGLVCAIVGVLALVRLGLGARAHWGANDATRGTRWRLTPRTLMATGGISGGLTLLFCFQILVVDLNLDSKLFAAQNQSLLIQRFLGYSVYAQLVPQSAFDLSPDYFGDRMTMLADLANPSLLLPLVMGLICLFGSWQLARNRRAGRFTGTMRERLREQGNAADVSNPAPESATRKPARPIMWLIFAGIGIIALLLFGRAPAALIVENLGEQAIAAGNYTSALQYFKRAQTLNPAFETLLEFHFQRGQALFQSGLTSDMDSRLYTAEHLREVGSLDAAQHVDQTLLASDLNQSLATQDMVRTLEWSIWQSTRTVGSQIPAGNESLVVQTKLVALSSEANTLPDLQTLAEIQPDNVFAFYLRGRILYSDSDYVHASVNFQHAITLTNDKEMQSTSYTYLSFCRSQLGDLVEGRTLLLKAIKLDDYYFNTTARDAASGLQ